ncbi:MAG: hypothetical protein JWO09_3120 [Bacteroidetes bacterium]|nr:hypothetical protein [Bacteroidota bacterium]
MFGQKSADLYRNKLPKTFNYSADTIKDIYVQINVLKEDDSYGNVGAYGLELDTTINLDKSQLTTFIGEFNKNVYDTACLFYKPMQQNTSYVDFYTLVFVSNNDIKTYYRIQDNLFVVTALWKNDKFVLMVPDDADIEVIYKLESRNILEKFNLVRTKRAGH